MNAFQASNYLARQYDKRWLETDAIVAFSKNGQCSSFDLEHLHESGDVLERATFALVKAAGCDNELVVDAAAVDGARRISRTLLTHAHKLASAID